MNSNERHLSEVQHAPQVMMPKLAMLERIAKVLVSFVRRLVLQMLFMLWVDITVDVHLAVLEHVILVVVVVLFRFERYLM